MLSVSEALAKVLSRTGRTTPARVPLAESLGLALAEDVASDIDSPPHDRATVDGYAVVAADLSVGSAELFVLEEVTAGAVPTHNVARGQCTRIMTGAPVPDGADAVVMIERTQPLSGDRVRITARAKPRDNIMSRGDSLKRGEIVLRTGHEIRPAEIGLLAEVGCTSVAVYRPPQVAVLSTGNELVEADAVPRAGQIRNSNGPLLAAAVRRAGAVPVELGIARDDTAELRAKIERGLTADMLVLSGGVSAGVLDLVPNVLSVCGVEQVFHKISLKPGKPLWFGATSRTLVFGLPGNPVSSLVCFELFIRPSIARLCGKDPGIAQRQLPAVLAHEFKHRGERPTYFPAVVRREGDKLLAEPVHWRGSADLRGVTAAGALAIFPAGDRVWNAGESIDVLLL